MSGYIGVGVGRKRKQETETETAETRAVAPESQKTKNESDDEDEGDEDDDYSDSDDTNEKVTKGTDDLYVNVSIDNKCVAVANDNTNDKPNDTSDIKPQIDKYGNDVVDDDDDDDESVRKQVVKFIKIAFKRSKLFKTDIGIDINGCYDLVYHPSSIKDPSKVNGNFIVCTGVKFQSSNDLMMMYTKPKICNMILKIMFRYDFHLNHVNHQESLLSVCIRYCQPLANAILDLPPKFKVEISTKTWFDSFYRLLDNTDETLLKKLVSRSDDKTLNFFPGKVSILFVCVCDVIKYIKLPALMETISNACNKIYTLLRYCHDDNSGIDFFIPNKQGVTAYQVLRNFTTKLDVDDVHLDGLQLLIRAFQKKQDSMTHYENNFETTITNVLKCYIHVRELLLIIISFSHYMNAQKIGFIYTVCGIGVASYYYNERLGAINEGIRLRSFQLRDYPLLSPYYVLHERKDLTAKCALAVGVFWPLALPHMYWLKQNGHTSKMAHYCYSNPNPSH